MRPAVQYIPIATTVLALAFFVVLLKRWRQRGGPHLLWFAVGALTYAAGTITESVTTLFGWNEGVFRAWYITGALMAEHRSRRARCTCTPPGAWLTASRSRSSSPS